MLAWNSTFDFKSKCNYKANILKVVVSPGYEHTIKKMNQTILFLYQQSLLRCLCNFNETFLFSNCDKVTRWTWSEKSKENKGFVECVSRLPINSLKVSLRWGGGEIEHCLIEKKKFSQLMVGYNRKAGIISRRAGKLAKFRIMTSLTNPYTLSNTITLKVFFLSLNSMSSTLQWT